MSGHDPEPLSKMAEAAGEQREEEVRAGIARDTPQETGDRRLRMHNSLEPLTDQSSELQTPERMAHITHTYATSHATHTEEG